MKRARQRRGEAVLLAITIVFGGRGAAARDTAGPEVPRAPGPAPPARAAATAATTSTTSAHEAAPTAPPPDADADAERAKQLYGLGAEAFTARRNAEAITYFRRAAELVPSAKLTYNIGLAYEEHVCHSVCHQTIDLLRHRSIATAQPSLNMGYGNP